MQRVNTAIGVALAALLLAFLLGAPCGGSPPLVPGLRVHDANGTDLGALVGIQQRDRWAVIVFSELLGAAFWLQLNGQRFAPWVTSVWFSDFDCQGVAYVGGQPNILLSTKSTTGRLRHYVPTEFTSDASIRSHTETISENDSPGRDCRNENLTLTDVQLAIEVTLPFPMTVTPPIRFVN